MRFLVLVLLAGCQSAPSRVEWLAAAPEGGVESIVQRELVSARQQGRRLLVYVGAKWCEPCRRFHEASAAGKLDGQLGPLRLLEFDFDRDEPRLREAGYVSRLIPLFAAPNPDGRASGRQIEGSVKGDGAVGEIAPRLRALLSETAQHL